MKKFFWEVSPICLLKQNPQYPMIKYLHSNEIIFLISEYKKVSNEIKKLLSSYGENSFDDYFYQILDREAYLSELAFYLKEFSWEKNEFTKIQSLLKSEYLIDYYDKLEFNFQASEEDFPIFLVGLLNNSITKATKKRFS